MRAWRLAGVAVVVALGGVFGGARAQLLNPVEFSMQAPVEKPATQVWEKLLRVEQEKTWEVAFAVRGFLRPRVGGGKGVRLGVFAMPWVERSATQESDAESVELGVEFNGVDVDPQPVWLANPAGMQRLLGAMVKAPAGQEFSFGSGVGDAVLAVDLELEFDATARRVRLDEKAGMRAKWPKEWPWEARGLLEPQVYVDSGVDPGTFLVQAIDENALKAVATEIAAARKVEDVSKVGPLKVAQEVAGEVCKRLKMGGSGIVGVSQTPYTGALSGLKGERIEGVAVRDALTVLRSGQAANEAERAVALAAVYRKLGLPARVMVGFEADEDDKEIKWPPEVEAPKPEAGKEGWRPMRLVPGKKVKWVRYHSRMAARSSRGVPSRKVARPKAPMAPGISPPVRQVEMAKQPRMRFWVEFALVDVELGLGWVPVDLGKGASDYRVGSLGDGERVVALASNLWPASIKSVGSYPCAGRRGQVRVGADGKLRMVIPGNAPVKGSSGMCGLPAGMWGYWTEGDEVEADYQVLSFDAQRKPVTSKDR